jgi:protoporphyrinogen oxidase
MFFIKIMHKTIVIIGGGLSGLVSANICSHLGIDTVIVEQSNSLGGGNKSKNDSQGNIFDYGHHALDENRSLLTTKFFQKVLKNEYLKFKLNRGIILKNNLFSYNEKFSKWPKEFQQIFKISSLDDDIKNNLNRKNISKIYGKEFTDFAFDQIMKSYPSIKWAIDNGGKEEDFFGAIYPWFFPNKTKKISRDFEWDKFHDKKRMSLDHYVLYPKYGGFQGFIDAIVNDIDMKYCKIKKNMKNLEIKTHSKTKNIESIKVNNELITGDLFFWCASPVPLAKILKIKSKMTKSGLPQTFIFGNFVFEKNISSKFHEILVGSSEHYINRISFPGKIRKMKNNLIQVEFSFPNNQFDLNKNNWKKIWLQSLYDLELVNKDNLLKNYSFISENRGSVSKYNLQFLTKLLKNDVMKSIGDNVIIPSFNLGPENINRVIPEVILNTIKSVSILNR